MLGRGAETVMIHPHDENNKTKAYFQIKKVPNSKLSKGHYGGITFSVLLQLPHKTLASKVPIALLFQQAKTASKGTEEGI